MSSRGDPGGPGDVGGSASRIAALEAEVARLNQELAATNRQRIEYLQNVAHQLVAPLNAMKWHIENLTEGRLGLDRAKKVLRSIYSQATIAVHLAKHFALMSNLEQDHTLGTLMEPLQPVELGRLMVNLADDFQPQGWGRSVNVEVDNASFRGMPDVLAVRPLMSQVFSNVIENGVKYAARDTVVVIKGEYARDEEAVKVRVLNKGIEIRESDRRLVFDRGYRTPEAKSANPAGTGFGLYIAKKIVDIHEGDIGCGVTADGLTVFEVTLWVRRLEGKARQWPRTLSS